MAMGWRTIGRLTELRLRRSSETLTAHCVGSALSDKQRSGQPKSKRCVMTDMTKKNRLLGRNAAENGKQRKTGSSAKPEFSRLNGQPIKHSMWCLPG